MEDKNKQQIIDKLVKDNQGFIVKMACQYRGQGVSLEDLISEGNLALVLAANKYDASRGTRFISYAAPMVRRQMEQAIEQQSGVYKVPRDAAPQARQNSHSLSVDAPLGHRSNMSLLSVLVNNNAPKTDERIYSEAVENIIELALLSLSPREATVISRFFGLNCERETMAEIADDMGIQRERVRQIRNHAIRRIKKTYHQKLKETWQKTR